MCGSVGETAGLQDQPSPIGYGLTCESGRMAQLDDPQYLKRRTHLADGTAC
jgi:hypothetical protein